MDLEKGGNMPQTEKSSAGKSKRKIARIGASAKKSLSSKLSSKAGRLSRSSSKKSSAKKSVRAKARVTH